MPEAVRIVVQDRAPRYVRMLLPVWFFLAFLTGVSFLPGIRNNFGPFEVLGVVFIGAYVLFEPRSQPPFRHVIIRITLLMTILAVISQVKMPTSRLLYGAVQIGILIFLMMFLITMRHLFLRYDISPETILSIIMFSVLIVGPWVYFSGASSGGSIEAAGPFRNRAHMANYMLTAFWLVAIYLQWPQLSKKTRYAAYAAAALALYAVAVSGRRSVYLALFIGLVLWVGSSITAQRGRAKVLVSALLLVGVLLGLYRFGHLLGKQGAFFQKRVGMIDDRLRTATEQGDDPLAAGFFELQRRGVMQAVRDSPVLGIGWGGFPKSRYSPTGHEVHSTPLRFLAELGIPGFVLYATFLGYLLLTSLRLFLRMRSSPYGSVYLVLAIATWSMSISHVYNRHITERTFWIYLAVFLALEIFAAQWHRLQQAVAELNAAGAAVPPGADSTTPGTVIAPRESSVTAQSQA